MFFPSISKLKHEVLLDTIVAIATPEGKSALGIIRLSGADAWTIAAQATDSMERFISFSPRHAHLVRLLDETGQLLDRAVTIPYKAPSSYTGEDLVEFTCHGGREVIRAVLHRLVQLGARSAEPGEFTQRAFLNGKMTLDQAEAVVHLIEARTQTAARAASRLMEGGLKGRLETLRQKLLDLLARVELGLDFIEEGLELETAQVTTERIEALRSEVDSLVRQYLAGRYLREGAVVVIAGAPNSGKSTLLNRLAGFDRAIVSETPGTTRDYIDVTLDWGGIPVLLYDTAGLRDTLDTIELEGARKAQEIYQNADRIIWLISPPDFEPPPDDIADRDEYILVINKIDLLLSSDLTSIESLSNYIERISFRISAKYGNGVDELCSGVVKSLLKGYDANELLLVERRHSSLLEETSSALKDAVHSLSANRGMELVATDLRNALNSLGEITGVISSDDLLHEIFSRFCVGK